MVRGAGVLRFRINLLENDSIAAAVELAVRARTPITPGVTRPAAGCNLHLHFVHLNIVTKRGGKGRGYLERTTDREEEGRQRERERLFTDDGPLNLPRRGEGCIRQALK